MNVVNVVFMGITALLILYMVLILVRVLATWFSQAGTPGFIAVIARLTDPYLALFARIRFLRVRFVDLSPVAALIVLQILVTITGQIAAARSLWFGLILSVFVDLAGQALAFLFALFAILALVRLAAILLKASSISPVWASLDHLLQPLVYPLATRLSPRRVMPYGTGLAIFAGVAGALWFLSWWGFGLLAALCRSLPF